MSAYIFSPFSDRYRPITRSSATDKSFDVFLSHKSNDVETCLMIAATLSHKHELIVYIDALDPYVSPDDPGLDKYLRSIIKKSRSLLTAVSRETKESWWVPFEIATALENNKLVGTQLLLPNNQIRLPTYLRNWPIFSIQDASGLDQWAKRVKRPTYGHGSYYIEKQQSQTSSLAGIQWI